jgi:peptidoglycan/LPS O-acetylase OafA/YrhL
MKHRSDIDGLRALAVIAVVLFHVGIASVSGGFTGVDVFFVISGYLITGIILKDIAGDRFSIAYFYERRVRRILPALIAVLVAAAIASYVLLPPQEFREFGESLIATALFSSNVLFWRQSGYFRAPAEMKPLLHTWSLAVEEQFYLFYPLFLWLISRYFSKRFRLTLLAVLGLSLALSIWGVRHFQNATFYLSPSRAWELLLGGLLAIPALPPLRHRRTANALAIFGLVLILYGFLMLSRTSLFPGLSALYPTIGTALIIYSGAETRTLVSRFLSLRPVVFVGLISYSLYLWHWVLIVLAKYYFAPRPLNGGEIAALLAASLVMAALSWRFIENPFRGRKHLIASRRLLFAAAAAFSMAVAGFGAAVYLRQGVPSRFGDDVVVLLQGKEDYWPRRTECAGRICQVGDQGATPTFILWGDSHASAIAPALERLAIARGKSGFVAWSRACAPVLGLRRYDEQNPEDCDHFNSSVLSFIKAEHIRTVFLHARWALNAEGTRYKQEPGVPALLTASRSPVENYSEFDKRFRATLEQLRQIPTNVVIIASVPEVGVDVPSMLARDRIHGARIDFAPSYSDFMERQARAFATLARAAESYGAQVIYPHETLCDQSSCLVETGKYPMYIDDNHLSTHGAMRLAPAFGPWVEGASSTAGDLPRKRGG